MVVAFYFRLHLAYFPRPVVAIFARPEQYIWFKQVGWHYLLYSLMRKSEFCSLAVLTNGRRVFRQHAEHAEGSDTPMSRTRGKP